MKNARKKCAAIACMVLAMVLLHAPAARTDVRFIDNHQQDYDFSKVKTIVILPFTENYRNERGAPVNTADIVPESVDVFSVELFSTGLKIIDRTLLDRVLSEQKLSLSGLAEKQDYQKIGKLLSADAVLSGSISLVKQFGKRRGEISIRLIDVATGAVVYSSVGEKSDIWGSLDVTSFRKDLMSGASRKFSEFLKKTR
jgi:curli biogenesis system outer membrane secretion channel CsgG